MALTPLSQIHRILVSRTDDLGDVVLTLPLARELRKHLPEVNLAFLVQPGISHLVDRIDEIDKTFTLPENGKAKEIFREYRPDAIIFAKPEFRLALEALRSRIDVRIGSGYMWYSTLFTRWIYDRRNQWGSHEAEFELNMLEPLLEGPFELEMPELPLHPGAAEEARLRLDTAGITGNYFIIHPKGRHGLPNYPISSYAEIGRTILHRYPDLSLVITAGKGEHDVAEMLKKEIDMESRTEVIDTLSPNGVSELLRGTSCFVSSPSDGAHLAALVGAPVVGLFPGNPPDWPQRRRPIGPHVITLTPDRNEPVPKGASGGQNPESIVGRIRPERVVRQIVDLLEQAGITP